MKILRISGNKKEIARIAKSALAKEEVIVFPTDTVYGLICDARSENAVKKIFEIKKRSFEKPIGIFVKNLKMAKEFAKIEKKQENFLNNFWPGKLTAILKKKKDLPVGEEKTIGIRIPDYKLIRFLFKEIDFPLAQTSANISGRPATTKIKEVLKQFEKEELKPDLVLDAGNLKETKPSTVIDLTGGEPKILREGEIKTRQITGA